jgi:pullulanase/glycogen debranching enzyme
VALTLRVDAGALELIFNAYWEALDFALPRPGADGESWLRIIDTSLASPGDIALDPAEAIEVTGDTYRVGPRSVVVLASRREPGAPARRRAR